MLKFIEKTAPWWGEAGKEVKGAQAAGVELRGLLCMNTAESKALVAIAIVGRGKRCWAWIHSPGQRSRSGHHPKKPYGGTL